MADAVPERTASPISPVPPEITRHSDPALDPANEHHHAHQHHTAFAEHGREDEVVYSKDTTFDKSVIPDAAVEHNSLNGKGDSNGDIEELGEGSAKRPWHRRMVKHWRHVFHAAVWVLFTG